MGAAVCAASRVGKGPIEIAAIRTAAPATTRNRDAVPAGRAFDWHAGVSLRGQRGRTQEWSSESGRKLGHCNIIALRYLPRAPRHRGADCWSRWKNDSTVRSVVGARHVARGAQSPDFDLTPIHALAHSHAGSEHRGRSRRFISRLPLFRFLKIRFPAGGTTIAWLGGSRD